MGLERHRVVLAQVLDRTKSSLTSKLYSPLRRAGVGRVIEEEARQAIELPFEKHQVLAGKFLNTPALKLDGGVQKLSGCCCMWLLANALVYTSTL